MATPPMVPRDARLPRRFGWPALGLVVLVVPATAFPETALKSAGFVAHSLILMTPIVVMAVALSSWVRASGAAGLLARVFAGRPGTLLLLAAGFGAITPICGLGVVPIIAGLLRAGVPLAPIMAFWLASPITDPSMLLVTAGLLGLPFALGKTVTAFAIGLLGGAATQVLTAHGVFQAPLRTAGFHAARTCSSGDETAEVKWAFWREAPRRAVFRAEAASTAVMMVKWLTIAFALESVLVDLLPPEMIAGYVGAGTAWAIPLAVALGTPIYLDGYAALPLVRGLIDLGMTPGAAMAFLVAGGITSAYASVAVFALVRWPVFLWYLALAVTGSAAGGYGFEALSKLIVAAS